jgi:hypothetical protein
MTIQELATEALATFVRKKCANGEPYYHSTADDGWITGMIYSAHGGMSPDDHKYDMIHSALYAIAHDDVDLDDMFATADCMVSDYRRDRHAWLSSKLEREDYVNEAISEYGLRFDISDIIAQGWLMEAMEVCASVVKSLQDELDNREGGAERHARAILSRIDG